MLNACSHNQLCCHRYPKSDILRVTVSMDGSRKITYTLLFLLLAVQTPAIGCARLNAQQWMVTRATFAQQWSFKGLFPEIEQIRQPSLSNLLKEVVQVSAEKSKESSSTPLFKQSLQVSAEKSVEPSLSPLLGQVQQVNFERWSEIKISSPLLSQFLQFSSEKSRQSIMLPHLNQLPQPNTGLGYGQIGYALSLHKEPEHSTSKEPGTYIEVSTATTLDDVKDQIASSIDPKEFKVSSAASRRRLNQMEACSTTDFTPTSIVACTNAFRADPDAFANDYPCQYESWRHEAVGKGLAPLAVDATLTQMAQGHTDDQARINQMTHQGADGSSLDVRADRAHFDWVSLGENIAAGLYSAKDVVLAWACSPGHRRNLVGCDFDEIGVGAATSSAGRTYFTQTFGCENGHTCGCSLEAAEPVLPIAAVPVPVPVPVPVEFPVSIPLPTTQPFDTTIQQEVPSFPQPVELVPFEDPAAVQTFGGEPFGSEFTDQGEQIREPSVQGSFNQQVAPTPPVNPATAPPPPADSPQHCGWDNGVWRCAPVPIAPNQQQAGVPATSGSVAPLGR